MAAADRWGGGLLVRESVIQRAAAFGNGAGQASDNIESGAPQSGTAAAGKAGYSMDGTQHNLLLLQYQGLLNQTT